MNDFVVYAAVLVAVAGAILAGFMSFAKIKVKDQNAELQGKLMLLEARNADLMRLKEQAGSGLPRTALANTQRGAHTNRPLAEDSPSKDLLEARRELAHTRDDVRKLKDELRAREQELKAARDAIDGQLYSLREENKALLGQLRERAATNQFNASTLTNAGAQNTQVATIANQAADMPRPRRETPRLAATPAQIEELAKTKARADALERQVKTLTAHSQTLETKGQQAQLELRKWREAGALADGKTLDPAMFIRWKERALEGRKMYQLMRQLRELSDSKLDSYQEGIVVLATHFLTHRNKALPDFKPGEVKADKFLAATWDAQGETDAKQPSNSPHLAPVVDSFEQTL